MEIIYLLLLTCIYVTTATNNQIILSLKNKTATNEYDSVTKLRTSIEAGITEIRLESINDNVGFLILQVHSFMYNLTLSHVDENGKNSAIAGTNNGLVYVNNNTFNKPVFYISNSNDINVPVLIAIVLYESKDPVPGGCNLSFDTDIAPYLLVSDNNEFITVSSQPPSLIDKLCEASENVTVTFYHSFIYQQSFEESDYMNEIDNMLTVDSIRKNGRAIEPLGGKFKYQRLFNSYRGYGELFVIVATYGNNSAAYVPAVTYACDLFRIGETCRGPVTWPWRLVCAFFFIFGNILCSFGHRYFRTTTFFSGCVIGAFIAHTLLNVLFSFSTEVNAILAITVGLLCGLTSLFIWWRFGIPYLSILPTVLLSGIFIASFLLYNPMADSYIFRYDVSYWAVFLCATVIYCVMSSLEPLLGHIFSTNLLGTYLFVISMCYYVGGHFQYIILTTYRRLAVKGFNMVVIDPPYQTIDIYVGLLWLLLIGLGFCVQRKYHQRRPPFPPARNQNGVIRIPNEYTPLLIGVEA